MNRTITFCNKLLQLRQSLFNNFCNVLEFAVRNEEPQLVNWFFYCIVTPVYFADVREGSFFQVVQGLYWCHSFNPKQAGRMFSQHAGVNIQTHCVKTKTNTEQMSSRRFLEDTSFRCGLRATRMYQFTHRFAQCVTSQDFILQLTLASLQDNKFSCC